MKNGIRQIIGINVKVLRAGLGLSQLEFSNLFHQHGYNSTGINQIISEANVAKASFYQYFKSKDDLCVAFLNARHEYSEWRNRNPFINDREEIVIEAVPIP